MLKIGSVFCITEQCQRKFGFSLEEETSRNRFANIICFNTYATGRKFREQNYRVTFKKWDYMQGLFDILYFYIV